MHLCWSVGHLHQVATCASGKCITQILSRSQTGSSNDSSGNEIPGSRRAPGQEGRAGNRGHALENVNIDRLIRLVLVVASVMALTVDKLFLSNVSLVAFPLPSALKLGR